VVVDLLQVKWKSFVKREFFIQMFLYTIFFCFASVAFIGRPLPPADGCGAANDTANFSTALPTMEDVATTMRYNNLMDSGTDGNSSRDRGGGIRQGRLFLKDCVMRFIYTRGLQRDVFYYLG
jgi:hypothetical protein